MKFFETSKYYTLKKSTYISLRWIGIIGQLISINVVYYLFKFDFYFFYSNLIVFAGIISNLYLIFVYKKTQLSDRSALIFLLKYIKYKLLITIISIIELVKIKLKLKSKTK